MGLVIEISTGILITVKTVEYDSTIMFLLSFSKIIFHVLK